MIRRLKTLSHGNDPLTTVGDSAYDQASSIANFIGAGAGVAIGFAYGMYKGARGAKSYALYSVGFGALGYVAATVLFSIFTLGMSQKG